MKKIGELYNGIDVFSEGNMLIYKYKDLEAKYDKTSKEWVSKGEYTEKAFQSIEESLDVMMID